MSSAFAQTLIGAAAAIVGGLGAAVWQTRRADEVARRIRQAERYEQSLLELNAKVSKAHAQFSVLYGNARTAMLRGMAERYMLTSGYASARPPLNELRDHWYSAASLVIADKMIADAFAALHVAIATHVWYDGNMAYSQKPPESEKVDATQFLQDMEAVYLAVTVAKNHVAEQVKALQPREAWLRRAISSVSRKR